MRTRVRSSRERERCRCARQQCAGNVPFRLAPTSERRHNTHNTGWMDGPQKVGPLRFTAVNTDEIYTKICQQSRYLHSQNQITIYLNPFGKAVGTDLR